jgi:dihydrofolate synthase/folylpolyglutamate synthase
VDYAEAWRWLDRLPRFEVKPGQERILRLVEHLGHPERSFPSVHVAGTNGKGSVVAMLSSILQKAGYRVGRYTSPEMVDDRDRICVDGEWIDEASFVSAVERLSPSLASSGDVPSQFEALTAIAFDYFRQRSVDVGVIEVGLGGRFDATNVVEPVLSILTTVDLDHTALLGDTVAQIAWEKAGIAKRGGVLLVGRLPEEAERVVREECRRVSADYVAADVVLTREGDDRRTAAYRVLDEDLPKEIRLGLLGGYQIENLRVALHAVRVLRTRGFEIPSSAVADGLNTVRWPGRFEVVRHGPTIVLEGAHNVAGARALAEDVVRFAPKPETRRLLFGVLRDKDAEGMLRILRPLFPRIAITQSGSPRALPSCELAARIADSSHGIPCYDSVKEAIREFVERAPATDVVVVTGSLTVVAEARRVLGVE